MLIYLCIMIRDNTLLSYSRTMSLTLIRAYNGHKLASQMLLDVGADPNGAPDPGQRHFNTPLHDAAKKADPTLALLLIGAGADIDIASPGNLCTPLHQAALTGSKVLEALLQAKADPNIPDYNEQLPIHYVASRNDSKQLRLLLQYGSNFNKKDVYGKTPLDIAEEDNFADVIRILTSVGAVRAVSNGSNQVSADGNYYPQNERDTLHTFFLLSCWTKHKLPRPRLIEILDAAEYWVKSTVEREEWLQITQEDEEYDDFFLPYIISQPIIGTAVFPVQKLVFVTRSNDQGFSSYPQHRGSYNESWTGFRARIRRSKESRGLRRERWRNEGKNEQEIEKLSREKEEHFIQCNLHAVGLPKVHTNVWSRKGWHAGLIRSLRKGDQIEVVPYAKYPGWQNTIYQVKLDIFTTYLR